ncbi:C45 family autoproteolytic acyltransferase/hydolase [Labrys wisconsinensis]|uniref:Isopenicillin-N N-acyltransferase-like protein n=1 Tax=Labrys wisconsinensis TaxID=425677 RepID=A0ABU0JHS4_9HYPH|nr:C45 family peptidase [Labrys wisconsinensis]MDQ0473041.1 isopenicillin-N N-acyltransferase-like protein [Labrys wisconsinensis]
MPRNPIPILVLRGRPFERGGRHGEAFAAEIQRALGRSKDTSSRKAYEAARGRAAHSWPLLEECAPEIAMEVQGLAEGSSSDVTDLYLRIGFEFFVDAAPTGCSGIAIAGPNGAVIGQNWDAPPEDAVDLALVLHAGEAGVETAMVASVGTLGWVGCNRSGLALSTNDLILDAIPCGLPSQVVRRLALDQASVPAAIGALRSLPNMGGRCYLLGDAAGAIAGVEISPSVGVSAMAATSPILHTNHARLPETAVVEDEARLQAVYPSSRSRLAALERLADGARTVADVMAVLRNRDGAPNAISKTPSKEEKTETAFSIVFDCAAAEIHLCAGPPSTGVYQTVRLSDPERRVEPPPRP